MTSTTTRKPASNLEKLLRNHGAHSAIYPQLHERGIRELTTVQLMAILSDLFQGTNLLVSAATSAGKTLIAEMACIHAILSKRGRGLFLVPLKSLANEKYQDFKSYWGSLGIHVEMSTGDMSVLDREAEEAKLETVDLLVATYERGDSILRANPEWFDSVQTVVVDEVHNVGSEGRGARLEGLLIRLWQRYPRIQFIYLSATIGNPGSLAVWLRATLVYHTHRPVPLSYSIEITSNRTQKIKEIVKDTLRQQGSLLIFTLTRFEAEALCKEIANYVSEEELLYLIDDRQLRASAGAFREKIHSRFDQRLLYSISKGVAFHHAGLSHDVRVFVEHLFRSGLVRIITCTPTLSAGVNMPAKVVIIRDVGLTQTYLFVKPNRLHQMCGRAGRPGYDDWGKAIILATGVGEKADIEVIYFQSGNLTPRLAPVESQIMGSGGLLEQYLVWIAESENGLKERDLQEMTFKTFWFFTQKRHHPDITIDHLTNIGYHSLEDFLTRHSSREAVEAAKTIPDGAVRIRRQDMEKLEAIIYDKFHLKTSFSKDHPDCACGAFKYPNRHNSKLCSHLIKLAQVIYHQNPSYAKDIILASLHEEQLIDQLLRYRMIKILNRRLQITKFGKLAYLLYLTPPIAHWIQLHLPRIVTMEEYINDILYVYGKERRRRLKGDYKKAFARLLEDEPLDFRYTLQQIGDELGIYPGDLEEFVEGVRWVANCFLSIAELDHIQKVTTFSEHTLRCLTPPELRQEEGRGDILEQDF